MHVSIEGSYCMKIREGFMMKKNNNDTFLYEDSEISCCPICSSDEFLLSEDQDVLICVECGPVPIKSKNSLTLTSNSEVPFLKSASTLH